MSIKPISVEYIESGTFVGGEEDIYNAGIESGDTCFVLSSKDFEKLKEDAWKYQELCK